VGDRPLTTSEEREDHLLYLMTSPDSQAGVGGSMLLWREKGRRRRDGGLDVEY
jgi:hypothetical protein